MGIVTPKGDTVISKVNSVPKANKVSKDDTVTSKGDKSKTTPFASNSSSPNSKTANAELPDAGDSLVARLSALPVIGLGFGLLLRRRKERED